MTIALSFTPVPEPGGGVLDWCQRLVDGQPILQGVDEILLPWSLPVFVSPITRAGPQGLTARLATAVGDAVVLSTTNGMYYTGAVQRIRRTVAQQPGIDCFIFQAKCNGQRIGPGTGVTESDLWWPMLVCRSRLQWPVLGGTATALEFYTQLLARNPTMKTMRIAGTIFRDWT